VLFESSASADRPIITKTIAIDQPVTWDAVEFPRERLIDLWREQASLLARAESREQPATS